MEESDEINLAIAHLWQDTRGTMRDRGFAFRLNIPHERMREIYSKWAKHEWIDSCAYMLTNSAWLTPKGASALTEFVGHHLFLDARIDFG